MKVVGALRSTFDRFGYFGGTLYLLNALLERLSGSRIRVRFYTFIAQPLQMKLALPKRVGASYETRVLRSASDECDWFPRPKPVIAARFAQGASCLAIFKDGAFAGHIWLALAGTYHEDEVRCTYLSRPPRSTAWDYDLYVSPAFRNGFAFAKLWVAVAEYLRQRDIHWSLSRVSAFNPESLAAHRRMGAVRIGSGAFLIVGHLQLAALTVFPYLDASFRGDAGPIIELNAPARCP